MRDRDRDRGVEVQPQLFGEVRASTGSPRFGACCRPRRADRRQVGLIDAVQHAPRGRHRRYRPEQVLAITEHRDAADRVRAIGDRDR